MFVIPESRSDIRDPVTSPLNRLQQSQFVRWVFCCVDVRFGKLPAQSAFGGTTKGVVDQSFASPLPRRACKSRSPPSIRFILHNTTSASEVPATSALQADPRRRGSPACGTARSVFPAMAAARHCIRFPCHRRRITLTVASVMRPDQNGESLSRQASHSRIRPIRCDRMSRWPGAAT